MASNSNSIEVPNYKVSDYMIKEPGIYQKPLKQSIKLSSAINLFNYYICIIISHPIETIIVHPKNKEQLLALKAFIKALKIDFTIEKSPYNPEFVAKIKRSEQQMKAGKGISIAVEDLWK
jgi:subtilase family serine protease